MEIKKIKDTPVENKRVLMRVDYNVSLNDQGAISNDERIRQTIPTLKLLLEKNNKLILVTHLGRPKGRDPKLSLKVVADDLHKFLPENVVTLVDDFQNNAGKAQLSSQQSGEIMMLENIRFYDGEKNNDPAFAKELASLADVFVNDAFGVCHRNDASVVGVAKILPSYAGLLLEKEINSISSLLHEAKKPFVAIIGGAKTSDKLPLLTKLTELADFLILGGGLANTFLAAQGYNMARSLVEPGEENNIKEVYALAKKHNTQIILPVDGVCATHNDDQMTHICQVKNLDKDDEILDIGPETQAVFGNIISQANTIIWNGPVGYTENPHFARGTVFLFYAITQNNHCFSVVGGGDTITAISQKEHLEKISHISTGGGAMLEFIEKGTLPGIDALKE